MAYGGSSCLTRARFSMRADILKPSDGSATDFDLDNYGEWTNTQDPLTGDIIQIWKPFPDNPNTPEDEAVKLGTIKCLARGIVDGGIRVAGTTERFGDMYENIDFVKMWTPAKVSVTKSDRITNIRNAGGSVIFWKNEESDNRATVFNVNGVTPLFDAFNNHVENFVLLERAEIQ